MNITLALLTHVHATIYMFAYVTFTMPSKRMSVFVSGNQNVTLDHLLIFSSLCNYNTCI